jgi:hypothetical protein
MKPKKATFRWAPPNTSPAVTAVDVPVGTTKLTRPAWLSLLRTRVEHMADHSDQLSYNYAVEQVANVDPAVAMDGAAQGEHNFMAVTHASPAFADAFMQKSYHVKPAPNDETLGSPVSDAHPSALLFWVHAVKEEGGLF